MGFSFYVQAYQYPVQVKLITSAETVVPENVTVFGVVAVWCRTSAGVVKSFTAQAQPLGALAPKVITGVQVPEVPEEKEPAVAPPTRFVVEQPDAENFVPVETTPPT